jgi:UDP-glucose 4-epimerase
VVHLGAVSAVVLNQEAPGPAYANNVASSTAGLLETCSLSGVAQVIFASTRTLYENTPELPQSEAK